MAISEQYTSGSKDRERRSLRPYPLFTIDEATEVPLAIARLNGGHPWPPSDVARALDMGARTPRFYYLTAAARDYGLTLGTRDANRIELTDLGRRLASAADAGARRQIKREAFLRVEVFRDVLRHYNGEALPDLRFLGNTLSSDFGIAPEHHREFADIFNRNYGSTIDTGATVDTALPSTVYGTLFSTDAFDTGETNPAPVPVVRRDRVPSTSLTGSAVVIAPSHDDADFPPGFFAEVRRGLLLPALQSTYPTAVDLSNSSPFAADFIAAVSTASVVVVDITAPDPATALAVGLRIGSAQALIAVRASGTSSATFSQSVFEYNRNLWPSTLRDDLNQLKTLVASPL